ncbi:ABC transporter ATP-binding protein [soil metagenome]|jgi:putative ABC transport system ATP-binding protein
MRLQTGLAVQTQGLGHTYHVDGEDVVALLDVQLTVGAGESVAILGPSGSGKSTLMTLLAGLRRPSSGRLYVGGDDIAQMTERELLRLRGQRVGVVVQNPSRNLLAYGTAEDNIRFAQSGAGRYRRTGLPDPDDLLAQLGLSELAGHQVGRMSGGEQQRLSVAMGMANSPGLLLADEPTSQLDSENRDRVVALLAKISLDFGTTVVAVTHDRSVAAALGRTITITAGRADDRDQQLDQYVTVTATGSVTLPEDVRNRLPPGSRLRVVRKSHGLELVADPPPSEADGA